MKKLLSCILGVFLFTSCSNNGDEIFGEQHQEKMDLTTKSLVTNDSIDIFIITNADWNQILSSNGEFVPYKSSQEASSARAYIDSRTVESCHSCNPRPNMDNMKVAFYDKELCDKIGIPQGIYITDYCEVKITLYTGEGEQLIPTSSPNCGLQPDGEGNRGYSTSVNGNKIVLTTYLTHIKYDISGKSINAWYPVNLNDLIWNYDIYIPYWN